MKEDCHSPLPHVGPCDAHCRGPHEFDADCPCATCKWIREQSLPRSHIVSKEHGHTAIALFLTVLVIVAYAALYYATGEH